MRTTSLCVFIACIVVLHVLGCASTPAQPTSDQWKPVPGRIATKWAKDVDPANPWPEYPRPTMQRPRWQSLNGLWDYAITSNAANGEVSWQGKILVPFAVESSLSGVSKPLTPNDTLHYQRSFVVPNGWKTSKQRVVLHFGAVDWETKVSVNGQEVGTHKGGYDPFSFDVTDAIKSASNGANILRVDVTDPTNTGGQPRGKQWNHPHGIWYTSVSGIWQTVWMEVVPEVSIGGLKIETDVDTSDVTIALTHVVAAEPLQRKTSVRVQVFADGKQVAGDKPKENRVMGVVLNIPKARLWSPEDPFLYTAKVQLLVDGIQVDEVETYFGMRSIRVAKDDHGINRIMLNNKPTFMFGPLDQGYWPDGLYTAPTVEAMKFDIEAAKSMGAKMLRKHVKVEPELFYYWCDKMGMLVWQDMPSPFFETPPSGDNKGWDEDFPALNDQWKSNFDYELLRMLQARQNHPSIVVWVPFNEGWGQNDLDWAQTMVQLSKQADPSRLINNASGWTDMKVGDLNDIHVYPGPTVPAADEKRARVLGEFGGLGLPIHDHTWTDSNNWGYISYKDSKEVTDAYVKLIRKIQPLISEGLCAAVYTQTTDVEIEVNGWLTYDRAVWKIDPAIASQVTKSLYGPLHSVNVIMPHAEQSNLQGAPTWWYTTKMPSGGWLKPGFKPDNYWKQGKSGFGTAGTPGAVVGTTWNSSDIWIRRDFELQSTSIGELWLNMHHDEDAEVYINGVLAATASRWSDGYVYEPISAEAKAALKAGLNTIAVHCKQTSGGQNIDVGLVELKRK